MGNETSSQADTDKCKKCYKFLKEKYGIDCGIDCDYPAAKKLMRRAMLENHPDKHPGEVEKYTEIFSNLSACNDLVIKAECMNNSSYQSPFSEPVNVNSWEPASEAMMPISRGFRDAIFPPSDYDDYRIDVFFAPEKEYILDLYIEKNRRFVQGTLLRLSTYETLVKWKINTTPENYKGYVLGFLLLTENYIPKYFQESVTVIYRLSLYNDNIIVYDKAKFFGYPGSSMESKKSEKKTKSSSKKSERKSPSKKSERKTKSSKKSRRKSPSKKKMTQAQRIKECKEKGLVYDKITGECRESKRGKKSTSTSSRKSPVKKSRSRTGSKKSKSSKRGVKKSPLKKKMTIAQKIKECREKGLVYDRETGKCRPSKRGGKKSTSRKSPVKKSRSRKSSGKKTIAQKIKECRENGLVYDRETGKCRPSKRGGKKSAI